MSAWAGIESVPQTGQTGFASAASASESATRSGFEPSPTARRVRRHQRPIIGSLDAAGVMLQRNAREVLLGSAFIIVPGVALNLVAASLAFDRYGPLSDSFISVPELFGGARASTGVEEVLWFVGVLVNSLTTCLVGGYAASLVARRNAGRSITIRGGYRDMRRHIPALVIAWVVGHCWIVVGAWALRGVSGVGLVPVIAFGVPLMMVFITMTLLASPAIVLERLGPFRGLARAWRLARVGFGMLFGFTAASALLGAFVQYGIAYLPRLLEQTGLVTFGRFGWLIEGAAGQLGRLIGLPLIVLATALVSLELRMNKEGLDLSLDAERAFSGSISDAARDNRVRLLSDPFVPIDQDPDAVRDAACRLVESSDVCAPPSRPPTIRTPSGAGGFGSFLGVLLWGLLIAVVVALVYVAVRSIVNRRNANTDDDGDDGDDADADARVGDVVIDPSRDPRSWRDEAESLRAAGRYREAIRCRYRALVGDLARRGLLDEIPGTTSGEERRQLSLSAPSVASLFDEAADQFDEAWFGDVEVAQSHDDRLRQLDRDVLASASRSARA